MDACARTPTVVTTRCPICRCNAFNPFGLIPFFRKGPQAPEDNRMPDDQLALWACTLCGYREVVALDRAPRGEHTSDAPAQEERP